MKFVATHLIALAVGLAAGALYNDYSARRDAFEAGAIAGVGITRLDAGLLRQGVTLTEVDIKRLIQSEWVKFNK